MTRLRTQKGYGSVSLLCMLFGKTKQAYYKYEDHSLVYSAQENFVLEYVKSIRVKDPGIGGEKLWLMYLQAFGSEYAVGRDRFCGIISKYGLNIRKHTHSTRTTDSNHNLPKYPDLTRNLLVSRPNELWVSDITYITIWLDEENYIFCYLSLVTDAGTSEIVGYCVGPTLESVYPLTALEMALKRIGTQGEYELIHHSDRGVQYASADYISRLKGKGVRISMTQTGNPKDNAVAERVNNTIKNELFRGMCFHNIEEVRRAVKIAVDFYNNERPHMSQGMFTPAQAAVMDGAQQKKWISHREKYLVPAYK